MIFFLKLGGLIRASFKIFSRYARFCLKYLVPDIFMTILRNSHFWGLCGMFYGNMKMENEAFSCEYGVEN